MSGEPEAPLGGEAAHHAAYLRFYRERVVAKARELSAQDLRRPVVPSGWTVLELLDHLAHMEQRWFVWGFLGEPVAEPWGENDGGDRDAPWQVADGRTLDDVVGLLGSVGARTEQVLASAGLDERGADGGRFDTDPPDLRWICFHVLQEYARHAGHLDVAVELLGGPTGE